MKMSKETLETRVGSLDELVPLFEEGTILESAELMNEQSDNPTLRNRLFWTANFAMYRMEGKTPVLYFGGRDNNPILDNIEEAAKQFRFRDDYVLQANKVESIVNSSTVLRVPLPDLGLTNFNPVLAYIDIPTNDYDNKLNNIQRLLAEWVYARGHDFPKNMQMLFDNGIVITRIYVLDPKYVEENAKINPIVRACWLSSFHGNCYFGPSDWGVCSSTDGALRGVLKVAEADM